MNGLQENFHAQFNENDGLVADFEEVQVVHADNYDDLINKPTINGVTVQGEKTSADYHLQDTLVSGTNIKTINNTSILGSGNIDTDEVFVAVYGQTSYASVKEAIESKKVILLAATNPSISVVPTVSYINSYDECVLRVVRREHLWSYVLTSDGEWSASDIFEYASTDQVAAKQDTLVSGESIKTINNASLLGSGNIAINEVFVAVYERTTYADVKAAIDAHKAIVLDMPANNNQFCMTYSTYTNGGNALMYAIYKMNDKPTLMTATLTPQNQWTISHTDLQDKLVSGTNIKTINGNSLLGNGDLEIGGGDVFIAEYGVTTYSEIREAIIAKKAILVQEDDGASIINYIINNAITFHLENVVIYLPVITGGTDDGYVEAFRYYVTPDSTWSKGQVAEIATISLDEWTEVSMIPSQLGTLTDLTTTDKSNLVGAINEVNAKSGGINFEVGVEKPYGTYKDGNTTYKVYSKVVYISALPSTPGITNYPHGVTNIKQVLAMYGVCTNGMIMNTPRQNNQDNIGIYQVQKSGNFAIEVGKDRSSIGAYVTIIYAKNN